MMQRFTISPVLVLVGLLTLVGCRNEMYDMEYAEPLEKSAFYDDNRASRPFVEGTVARGHLREDRLMYEGKNADGSYATVFPMEVTEQVMLRGQERYNIFCSPCHGEAGRGNGIIVRRGMKQPPSFLEQRLIDSEIGYYFEVISNGFGVMYSYASRVKPEDRWAIIAYVRALQRTGDPVASTVAVTDGGSTPAVEESVDSEDAEPETEEAPAGSEGA